MIFTQTHICNMALGLIGQESIVNIDEESSAARRCKLYFDINLIECLGLYPWTFAQKRITLNVENGIAPTWGFQYSFNLPDDFVRMVHVGEKVYPPLRYKIERGMILTDSATVDLLYISNDIPIEHYPIYFVNVLYSYLAMKISRPLGAQNEEILNVAAIMVEMLKNAIQLDSQENTNYAAPFSFIEGRF